MAQIVEPWVTFLKNCFSILHPIMTSIKLGYPNSKLMLRWDSLTYLPDKNLGRIYIITLFCSNLTFFGVYLLASPKFLDVSLIFPAPLTGKNNYFFDGQLTVFPETSPNSALVGLPDLDDRLFTAVTDQLTVFAESSPNPLAVFLGYESALLLFFHAISNYGNSPPVSKYITYI